MNNVTESEARQFLAKQVQDWKNGWANLIGPDKGQVTHPTAVHAIACLREVLRWKPSTKPKTRKRAPATTP